MLGDQMVVTPASFGCEPTAVNSGSYVGIRVFEAEERDWLQFVRSLSTARRAIAMPASTEGILRPQRMDGRIQTAAFRDNIQLAYAGFLGPQLSADGRRRLLDLVELYIGRMRDQHARVKMEQVERHVEDTHFVWAAESTTRACSTTASTVRWCSSNSIT